MPSVDVDIDTILIDVASRHHHLLTRSMVRDAGISDARWLRRVHDGTWLELAPGVFRHSATQVTFELLVRAGSLWLGHDAALYGRTAGRWLGLDGCDTDAVEFLVPRGRRFLPAWLVLHTTLAWSTGDVVTIDGVRTCTATRAIIDMAANSPARAVEAAIDSAIRLRRTSVPTIVRRLDELGGKGRPGTRLIRALLLDSGGESYLERSFLSIVRRHQLPRPSTQVTYRTDGNKVIRVDFEYATIGLVVEVSGKRGHASGRDLQKDARRRNALTAAGKTWIEFTTADVLDDPDYVVRTLRTHLHVMP